MVATGPGGVRPVEPQVPRAPWRWPQTVLSIAAPGLLSPWWALHTLVWFGAAGLLWAFSLPGFSLILVLGAVPALCLAGTAWAVWVVMFGVRRQWSWGFLPAPMIVVLALALLVAGAPLQARWAMSRSAFEQVVATLPTTSSLGGEWSRVPVPSRIGAYYITSAYPVPGGVVFYEANGNLLDDAGFAYLPEGPTPDLETPEFESPVFKHLGGAWYSWTASW